MRNWKLILSFIFILYNTFILNAQNWIPLDKGIGKGWADIRFLLPDSNDLYVSGSFTEDGNNIPMRGIARWDGLKWDSVGDANKFNGTKHGIYRYKDTLITSGIFYTAGHTSMTKLNGLYWNTILGSDDMDGYCYLEKGGILYIGGGFNKCGDDSTFSLGKYDGKAFTGMTPCYKVNEAQIYCLAFFQDTLYIGGNFYLYPKKPIACLAKWDGQNIVNISPEFVNNPCSILTMKVYKNELYVGGHFTKAGGFTGDYIMKWDGHQFSEVGGGVNQRVTSMTIYDNELYIGGRFTQVGGVVSKNIAKWNGNNWVSLNEDVFDDFDCINDICIYKDELYVAGYFRKIGNDSISSIAKYNHKLSGISETNTQENKLTIFPNPSTNNFTIEFSSNANGTAELSIYGLLGEKVFTDKIKMIAGANKTTINIAGLAKGVYVLRVNIGEERYYKKIVKE